MDAVDVLVIGGGPGGTPAAMALARGGKRVLLVEGGTGLGGTCLFEGCIPSKILRESAARRAEIERAEMFGLSLPQSDARVDWEVIQARRTAIVEGRAAAALREARAIHGLEVRFGRARLIGPRQAMIAANGEERPVRFQRAILATGSVPNRLPVPGADLPGVLTSERLILLDHLPRSMVLIGGGPIGVEMAQIFQLLGTHVTLLEAMPTLLGTVDAILAAQLTAILREEGIGVQTSVEMQAISSQGTGYRTAYLAGGHPHALESEIVTVVIGRHPHVDDLGLEHTRVRHDQNGVQVNAQLETAEDGIYATGDLVGQPMFAHWATAQALALADHLLGRPVRFPTPDTNSMVVFSRPELGMAGLTEPGARAAGLDVAVADYDYRIDARAQIAGEAHGRLRIVYRRDTRQVVGIHALVEGAADLMGEAALAVENGLTLDQIAAAIHPHPTLTESFGLLARAVR